jgi:nucleoside-diphosphate-sugar epimerase
MRILLIGGNGFIGPPVISRLQQLGHEITLFHRGAQRDFYPELKHIRGDRQQLPNYVEIFRELAPDVVLDFILSSGRQARELMATFKGISGRVVALSSMDVYRACGILHGLEPGPLQAVPLTEDSDLRTTLQTYPPQMIQILRGTFEWVDTEYDKIPVEQAILSDPDLPGTILRLPFVYGPGDRLHRFFSIVKRVDDGRKVILMDEAVAQWRAPWGYVENVGAAIVAAITSERAAGRIYNVAELYGLNELEWTKKIAEAAGWRGEIKTVSSAIAPAHVKGNGNLQQHWLPDASRIRRELGYHEPVDLEQALKTTVAWERANPPQSIDLSHFDYAAEDACVESLAATQNKTYH